MSKPAPLAKDAELDRRARFNRYIDRQLAAPPAGSTWHWSYQWPSETRAEYAMRTAPFRSYGECRHRLHVMSPDNTYETPDGRRCRTCSGLKPATRPRRY